uniref:Uncharacterized protein n=1 Tax=Hyaloperonospora arabidopsidis (strain Emoy2) TaxID=559515 RepID=M4BQW6_HYAAE
MKEMAALQSTRTFKKYYGLPNIPLSAPLLQQGTGSAQIANFSYRDTCKRCRVGRLEDAGFVFSSSMADPST